MEEVILEEHKETTALHIGITFWRVGTIAKRRLSVSSWLAVRPSAWHNSAPTGQIFIKFECFFPRKSVEKNQFS
jgi:hypothetical protein